VGKSSAVFGNFFAHRDKCFEKNREERGGKERKGESEKREGKGRTRNEHMIQTHYNSNTKAKVASMYIEQTVVMVM
jgi:hypothetical protein